LMDKWNKRYPSDLPVDLIDEADLDQIIRYVDALPHSIVGERERAAFERWILKAVQSDLARALEGGGYQSLEDMLMDRMDAQQIETVFGVDVAEPLEDIFGGLF